MIDILLQKFQQFEPYHLKIVDKSASHINHKHNIKQCKTNMPTHLSIEVGSKQWQNISLLARHKIVKQTLKNEFDNGLHSLSIKIITDDT